MGNPNMLAAQDHILAFLKRYPQAFTTRQLIAEFGDMPESRIRSALTALVKQQVVAQSICHVSRNGGGNYANTYKARQ